MAGFGRIVDLKPEQFLTDIADAAALLEAEQGAVEHMNDDHREAMNLYATKLLGAESADWRCTGCDPDGIDLQAGSDDAAAGFPGAGHQRPGELRKMLVRLAGEARAKGLSATAIERARLSATHATRRVGQQRSPHHEIPQSIGL